MTTMLFQEHVSLKKYTSFAVEASARYFASFSNEAELRALCKNELWKTKKHFLLGSGTNVLFTQDFDGVVLHNEMKGRKVVSANDHEVFVHLAAGEDWHDFVLWSCKEGYWGIENLALIPGSIGAAPVQNIGAYGVEVASVIHTVSVFDTTTGATQELNQDDCYLGYRSSLFKDQPDRYIVLGVTFRLSKQAQPQLGYAGIQEVLKERGIETPSAQDICDAVITIREAKLPRVGELGMAGSFFKNPVIDARQYEMLKASHPDIPGYILDDRKVKIPAAWLITKLGYKGTREGSVGTYEKHALVLVNYGEATGGEVWAFAKKLIHEVSDQFNITLEPEVLIV